MTTKVTAITVSVCVALLSVLAAQFPNDPYFFVVSSNLIVVLARLLLTGLFVHLVFMNKNKFQTVYGHVASRYLGIALIIFGMAGTVIMPLSYALFTYLKPVDYMFMIGMGTNFVFMSLAYKPGKRQLSLPRLSRPRNTQLRLFTPRSA